jgi:hypothetical protein
MVTAAAGRTAGLQGSRSSTEGDVPTRRSGETFLFAQDQSEGNGAGDMTGNTY